MNNMKLTLKNLNITIEGLNFDQVKKIIDYVSNEKVDFNTPIHYTYYDYLYHNQYDTTFNPPYHITC